MSHVSLDQVTSGESSTETEFTGKDRGSDDPRKLASVVSGVCGVSATNTEEIQHRGLSLKDSATTNGSNLDRRHGDGDLKVSVGAERTMLVS